MGLISETSLALLLIASTYITTTECTGFVTASKFWLSNQQNRSPKESVWSFSRFPREAMIGNTFNNIFYPLRCNPYARNLKDCAIEDEMNETVCLIIECCFKDRPQHSCFHKTINGPKQIMTILGIGIVSILFVMFCPFLCCLITQRTKLNSLLRKNKAVEEAKMKDVEVGAYILSLLKEQRRKGRMLAEDKSQPTNTEDP